MPVIKLIVEGGSMKPGPAVAQQLGPMGINLGKVIEDVNKATSGFKGMKVPVELDVDPKTKNYAISVSSPPVSEMLKKELKLEKAAGDAGKTKVGNLAIEQIIGIARTKMPNMLAKDLKAAVNLTLGSCVSLGILVESKLPQKVTEEVNAGRYDDEIKNEKTEASPEKLAELDNFFKDLSNKQQAAAKAALEAKAAEDAAKAEAAAAAPATAAPASAKDAKKPEAKKK